MADVDRITALLTKRKPSLGDIGLAAIQAGATHPFNPKSTTFGEQLNAMRAQRIQEEMTLYKVLTDKREQERADKQLEMEGTKLKLQQDKFEQDASKADRRFMLDMLKEDRAERAEARAERAETRAEHADARAERADVREQAKADREIAESATKAARDARKAGREFLDPFLDDKDVSQDTKKQLLIAYQGMIEGFPVQASDRDYMNAAIRALAGVGIDVKSDPRYSGEVLFDPEVGQFYQINPKTGKLEFTRPNEEFEIETLPDGSIRIRKGPAGSEMTKRTQGTLEDRLLAAHESLVRLKAIKETFRPEFQEVGTRLAAAWTSLQARFDSGDISPEDREFLGTYAVYRRRALDNINRYIKEITGAQMSVLEAERLKQSVPDPGAGGIKVWTGDDPITFEAKLDDVLNMAARASYRYRYYIQQGIQDPEQMASLMPLDMVQIAVNEAGQHKILVDNEWVDF